jgi:hypothetical protein
MIDKLFGYDDDGGDDGDSDDDDDVGDGSLPNF